MADKDPPSPEREDYILLFRRLRVKPAMRSGQARNDGKKR